jgi:predicted nucleic acid-binding protein
VVIVDTSVWVDFMREGDARVSEWITADLILQHPFVTAEIGMGNFRSAEDRTRLVDLLDSFEQIDVADSQTFHHFVSHTMLYGTGIGFADAQLIYACTIHPTALLATRDKRLVEQAQRLGINSL